MYRIACSGAKRRILSLDAFSSRSVANKYASATASLPQMTRRRTYAAAAVKHEPTENVSSLSEAKVTEIGGVPIERVLDHLTKLKDVYHEKQRPKQRSLEDGPLHDLEYIKACYEVDGRPLPVEAEQEPMRELEKWWEMVHEQPLVPPHTEEVLLDVDGSMVTVYRSLLAVPIPIPNATPIVLGKADHPLPEKAEELAALSALYQLHQWNLLEEPPAGPMHFTQTALPDGSVIDTARAREFIDWYCERYSFTQSLTFTHTHVHKKKPGGGYWESDLRIENRTMGVGHGRTKEGADGSACIEAVKHLTDTDAGLWGYFADPMSQPRWLREGLRDSGQRKEVEQPEEQEEVEEDESVQEEDQK